MKLSPHLGCLVSGKYVSGPLTLRHQHKHISKTKRQKVYKGMKSIVQRKTDRDKQSTSWSHTRERQTYWRTPFLSSYNPSNHQIYLLFIILWINPHLFEVYFLLYFVSKLWTCEITTHFTCINVLRGLLLLCFVQLTPLVSQIWCEVKWCWWVRRKRQFKRGEEDEILPNVVARQSFGRLSLP